MAEDSTILQGVNAFRLDTSNIGDLKSAPYQYFPDLQLEPIEITQCHRDHQSDRKARLAWLSRVGKRPIIVGGGGLLTCNFFESTIQRIAELDNPKIIWGAGHNEWRLADWRKLKQSYTDPLKAFDLIGVRDADSGHPWVPCVSCMDSAFDAVYETKHEVGFFLHSSWKSNKRFWNNMYVPEGAPVAYNDMSFEETVDFLASCELIVTSSYHGAYWATLLKRKVVAIPSTSKFYSFKHPVPLCHPEDWRRYRKLARSYQGALKVCREANLVFAEKVRSML